MRVPEPPERNKPDPIIAGCSSYEAVPLARPQINKRTLLRSSPDRIQFQLTSNWRSHGAGKCLYLRAEHACLLLCVVVRCIYISRWPCAAVLRLYDGRAPSRQISRWPCALGARGRMHGLPGCVARAKLLRIFARCLKLSKV